MRGGENIQKIPQSLGYEAEETVTLEMAARNITLSANLIANL